MKFILLLFASLFLLFSCFSKKPMDDENLPKDVALRPEREKTVKDPDIVEISDDEQIVTVERLNKLKSEIEQLISTPCDDASKWRISPFGAKPCGGPASYIAYPIDLENEVIPKITKYNSLASEYNKQKGLMSDCAIVPPPSGIKCENGKALLERSLPAGEPLN